MGLLSFTKDIFGGEDYTAGGIARNTILGLPKAAKDIFLPSRGFSEQEIKEATPTVPERLKGVARSGTEIFYGLGKLGGGLLNTIPGVSSVFQRASQTKTGGLLADMGQKIDEFSIPKTAGEAKVMRFADVFGFLPIGSVKNYGKVVENIAKSKNVDEIATLLQKTGVSKESIPTMSKVLTGVDNPRKVNAIIEGFDVSQKASTPPPKVGIPETLQQKQFELEVQKDILANNPAKQLEKYASKQGDFAGGLKEVTGGGKVGVFGRRGDDITSELGFEDSEQAREAFLKYKEDKVNITSLEKELKQEIADFKATQKSIPRKTSAEGIPLALTKREREIIKTPLVDSTLSRQIGISRGEAKSIEIQAEQASSIAKGGEIPQGVSLPKIITNTVTPVKNRVHIIDTFIRTPDRVMAKIGFGQEAKQLRTAMDGYWKELPKNIKKIEEWQKQVSKESNVRIFKFLDGQAIDLRPEEQKVADEIKTWLSQWASRLNLGKDNRITDYITHIFDKEFQQGGFDEELAKIITDKIPGSVYNPFTLKRLGAKGYKQDTWQALDAYVKRGTRKVYLDPVLENIQTKAGRSLDVANVEKSQYQYIQKYISNINMRPTDLDESIDNILRSAFGNRLGQRPVNAITKFLRQLTYRGMLGLNPGSALRNVSQGINTYAVLGEKYTTIGYAGLFKKGAMQEMEREGVLSAGFIQDKVLSATRKKIQQADKGLFAFFDMAERINRGSAYYGAKAKGVSIGYSEEKAIEYAKSIVRKTQFVFDSVDTPVGMQSDIAKTLFQFQTFTTKQIEFLTEMAKDKNFVGLLRYAVAGTAFVYTVGKAFGMEPKELIPWYRFDIPPSLKFPVEATKALVDAPDKYGNQRDLSKKMSDVGKSVIGLIPAGTQAKKTIEGIRAVSQGKSTDAAGRAQFDVGGTNAKNIQAFLFGKYAGSDAKAYFDGKKYAESRYEKLLISPTPKQDFDKIIQTDKNLAQAILRVKEKIDLRITPKDEKLLSLGVANKMRAKFVAKELSALKTKEQKAALWEEYVNKKIITVEVSRQLAEMLK